ncbi:Protein-tyrosine phosphatase containing protein [Tritrichomonas foetus]|uniref:protein-tyrosine-phosphatase n=1 Tax=Tritrichomonas foetus TaxID=1144522 RepID=A0A1J4KLF6_9EUKA|nr:Protein-tyrosine phosphatase containing protein [Tritrichomonas foetus]|eukprot:OHT12135.1 Protein-tyrosine phosphatase containing protein [Tritrichomonas foetus]
MKKFFIHIFEAPLSKSLIMKRTMMNSSNTITIIPNRLSFTILDDLPNKSKTVFYYSTEDNPAFAYQPFYADFGPNSLLQVHKFLGLTKRLLEREKIPLIYFCTDSPFSITNSIFLISSFSMIYHETSPQKAYEPFRCFENFVRPYRDASSLQSLYDLSIYSCLKGLHKAMKLGWYNPNNFDVLQWEKYEQVPNGDMNWLIPGKLMAFATPYSSNIIQGWKVCTPNDLVPVFKGFKITRIIRLTNKIYDETIFMKNGFKFTELFFEDGTTPPEHILKRFLELMQSDDVIALHCKAGLGRTFVDFDQNFKKFC